MEEWKAIPGLDGYEASSEGRIRSISRLLLKSDGNIQKMQGRIRKLGSKNGSGYLQFNTMLGNKLVHVCVCSAFHGERPFGKQAAHNNGIKDDNRSDNLRWATPKENIADMKIHGTHKRPAGELASGSKLKTDQVLEIRRLHKQGVKGIDLANKFGVHKATISNIVLNQRWTHLSDTNFKENQHGL